jgi:hypothetical protein
MYVHTHTHTCTRTHMHTYIHTYTRTYIHTYIHTCIHTYIYIPHAHARTQGHSNGFGDEEVSAKTAKTLAEAPTEEQVPVRLHVRGDVYQGSIRVYEVIYQGYVCVYEDVYQGYMKTFLQSDCKNTCRSANGRAGVHAYISRDVSHIHMYTYIRICPRLQKHFPCAYVCIYIHTHTYVHIYIHTYIHTYIRIYVCIHTYIQRFIYVYTEELVVLLKR